MKMNSSENVEDKSFFLCVEDFLSDTTLCCFSLNIISLFLYYIPISMN